MTAERLLSVENLCCGFDTELGYLRIVDDVSFEVRPGETLGLVGESGCGKSVTALSIMGLLPKPAGRIESGQIQFENRDLTHLSSEDMQHVRGNRIAMIFQEPMTALNPVHRIGRQLIEALALHQPQGNSKDYQKQAVELLTKVGIPEPEQRMANYPHQLSGGMRQRVMIAMALSGKPDILIADEPTTALDVTVQAQILDLIRDLQQEYGMAVIFITHDLGVVAEVCERVIVMYAGRIVEQATTNRLFLEPRHPYTHGLLNSIPQPETKSKTLLPIIPGMVPSPADLPQGCRFNNRCLEADAACSRQAPPLERIDTGHRVACVHWKRIANRG